MATKVGASTDTLQTLFEQLPADAATTMLVLPFDPTFAPPPPAVGVEPPVASAELPSASSPHPPAVFRLVLVGLLPPLCHDRVHAVFDLVAQQFALVGFQRCPSASFQATHLLSTPFANTLFFFIAPSYDMCTQQELCQTILRHHSAHARIFTLDPLPSEVHISTLSHVSNGGQLVQAIHTDMFNVCTGVSLGTKHDFTPRLVLGREVQVRLEKHGRLQHAPLRERWGNCSDGLIFAIINPFSEANFLCACEKLLWDRMQESFPLSSKEDDRGPDDGPAKTHLPAAAVGDADADADADADVDAKEQALLNTRTFFHAMCRLRRRGEPLHPVLDACNHGLDLRRETGGRFGRGLYLTDFPVDSILYCEEGRMQQWMAVFICDVALGRPLIKAPGEYDPTLFMEPPGYHSLIGTMRFGRGAVQYRPHTSHITHVAFCCSRITPATLARFRTAALQVTNVSVVGQGSPLCTTNGSPVGVVSGAVPPTDP